MIRGHVALLVSAALFAPATMGHSPEQARVFHFQRALRSAFSAMRDAAPQAWIADSGSCDGFSSGLPLYSQPGIAAFDSARAPMVSACRLVEAPDCPTRAAVRFGPQMPGSRACLGTVVPGGTYAVRHAPLSLAAL